MAKLKHKIFQIPIDRIQGKIIEKYDSGVLKDINDFLEEANRIYIGHSISTISENTLKSFAKDAIENESVHNATAYQNPQHKQNFTYFRHINIDKYIAVSLIYKELDNDEIEEGIYQSEPLKLPNTKKPQIKPEILSEADKYILKTKKD